MSQPIYIILNEIHSGRLIRININKMCYYQEALDSLIKTNITLDNQKEIIVSQHPDVIDALIKTAKIEDYQLYWNSGETE